MNNVILIGRPTRDPEIRYSQSENPTAIARYTLAVNRPFKQNGEQVADFISCVAFGKTAELIEKYVYKGSRIAVKGRIQTGSYTNQEGQKIYTTEVVVEQCEFLERANGQSNANTPENHGDGFMNIPDGIDEELPFN